MKSGVKMVFSTALLIVLVITVHLTLVIFSQEQGTQQYNMNTSEEEMPEEESALSISFWVIACESNLTSLWTAYKERNVSASCCNIHIYSYLITNESGTWNLQCSWLSYKPLSFPHFIIIKQLKCICFISLQGRKDTFHIQKSFSSWDGIQQYS